MYLAVSPQRLSARCFDAFPEQALHALTIVLLLTPTAPAFADDCLSGSELEFEAKTGAGHPFPNGLVVFEMECD